jgi:hypothetical protein
MDCLSTSGTSAAVPTGGRPKKHSVIIPDRLRFHLVPSCAIQLEVGDRRFTVVGPDRAANLLHRVADKGATPRGEGGSSHGRHSPISRLSIPVQKRDALGIPRAATHYCFACPLDCLKGDYDTIVNQIVGSADHSESDEALVMLFLLGGFIYLAYDDSPNHASQTDGDGGGGMPPVPPRVLSVSALTFSTTASAILSFSGPYAVSAEAVDALTQQGRMCDVIVGRLLRDGVRQFAWVNPQERPGGHALSESSERQHENGAYVYTSSSGNFYYALRPLDNSKVLVSDVPNALQIHEAFKDLITTYSTAKYDTTQLHTST